MNIKKLDVTGEYANNVTEKYYDKLVRDNIPNIIEQEGNVPVVRILSESEYLLYLNKKLKEELEEYLEENCVEELCDILEVIKAIAETMNFSSEKFEKIRRAKEKEKGAFKNKILLEKIIVKATE